MTKPPSAWRGHASRDDLHEDPPMTLREQAIACATMAAVVVTILTFAVIGVLSR